MRLYQYVHNIYKPIPVNGCVKNQKIITQDDVV